MLKLCVRCCNELPPNLSYCSKCGFELEEAFSLVALDAKRSQLESNIRTLENRASSSSLNILEEDFVKEALEGLREELEVVKAEKAKLLSRQPT